MEKIKLRYFVFLLILVVLFLPTCGGGGGGGGGDGGGTTVPTTTTLQHPLFPSTIGDTWTWEWRDTQTKQVVDTETETVTAVSGNTLTIVDDTGHETYYEIREDPQGRKYVVKTGGNDFSVNPPLVIIPPDLTPGATFNGGSYQITTAHFSATCTSYTFQTFSYVGLTVPAGTFNGLGFTAVEHWPDGSGGTYEVNSEQRYAPDVGCVFQVVPEFDANSGLTGIVWEVRLTSYTVH